MLAGVHEREPFWAVLSLQVTAGAPRMPPVRYPQEAHMAGTRKVIDCRRFPAEKPCTITIAGTEDEVLDLAVLHATNVHGHANTPDLREQIRSLLQDESAVAEAA